MTSAFFSRTTCELDAAVETTIFILAIEPSSSYVPIIGKLPRITATVSGFGIFMFMVGGSVSTDEPNPISQETIMRISKNVKKAQSFFIAVLQTFGISV